MQPVKLIYIVSASHSGSTLLDLMLSHHAHIQGVGEVMHLKQWLDKDLLCSCNQPLSHCHFWQQVLNGASNCQYSLPLAGTIRSPMGNSSPIQHFWPSGRLYEYGQCCHRLFSRVQQVSGKPYILDSSKALGRLKALLNFPELDVRIIHLVRDVRSVCASAAKSHRRPSFADAVYTQPIPVSVSALKWLSANVSLEMMATSKGLTYKKVFYEDLVRDPQNIMKSLCCFLELPWDANCLQPKTRHIHNISGSRWRYRDDQAQVSASFLRQPEMSFFQRGLVTMIAGVKNRRYGYAW